MPEQKQRPKQSHPDTNKRPPARAEVEAEVPQPPAHEPLAQPTPVDSTRGPQPRIEPVPAVVGDGGAALAGDAGASALAGDAGVHAAGDAGRPAAPAGDAGAHRGHH